MTDQLTRDIFDESEFNLFTFGYQDKRPEYLLDFQQRLKAIIVDIRLHAFCKPEPRFSKRGLMQQYGDQYIHLPALGNLNYKGEYGSGFVIKDIDEGIPVVLEYLKTQNVILMCMCSSEKECHRTRIVDILEVKHSVPLHKRLR